MKGNTDDTRVGVISTAYSCDHTFFAHMDLCMYEMTFTT